MFGRKRTGISLQGVEIGQSADRLWLTFRANRNEVDLKLSASEARWLALVLQHWAATGETMPPGERFTAQSTRRELLSRLAEAMTSDTELERLVEFLRDDLAYAPDNRSIIGAVLRQSEFECWRDLMVGVQWQDDWPIQYDMGKVRALSGKLLAQMQAP